MSELRQAAIRLKDYSWMKINGPLLSPAVAKAFKDMHDVSTAYLAEHLEDDDELITEAWIKKIAVAWPYKYTYRLCDKTGFTVGLHGDRWMTNWMRDCELRWVKTRGELRRLCRALGVELKS
jgi:hypothetical protein